MINKTYQRLFILPLMLLTSLSAQANSDIVWKKRADYVAISNLSGASENNHPKDIAVDKIARLLSQVQVINSSYRPSDSMWDDSEAAPVRVFTDREIDLLGNKLNQAFKQVTPNEVVVFSISDFRSAYVGRKRLSISGTAFIKDNKLNLLIGAMHADLLAKQLRSGITGTYGRLKNDLNTGEISGQDDHEWALVAFTGANKVNGRSDWLSIDLQKTYQYAVIKEEQQRTDSKYLSEEQKVQTSDALEERIAKLEQERTATPAQTEGESSIEGRLRKLQSLYENGALPEAIYLEKVRTIMSEL